MRKSTGISLLLALCLACSSAAYAVSYTEDGGMVVNGNGTDDFSNATTADPNVTYTTIVLPSQDGSSEEGGDSGPGPLFVKGDVIDISVRLEDGSEVPCTVTALGTVISKVKVGRESFWAPTASLIYETEDVPPGQTYATIKAPRTGRATMHIKASAKSDVVGKCTTNRVVLVLKIGKKYSRVWYDGEAGYVLNTALEFRGSELPEVRSARMTYRGKTKSRATINIRQNGKNGSRILSDIPCGSVLTVFSETEDGWTEIEVDGWHAWVQSKYVTYEEDLPESQTAAGTDIRTGPATPTDATPTSLGGPAAAPAVHPPEHGVEHATRTDLTPSVSTVSDLDAFASSTDLIP